MADLIGSRLHHFRVVDRLGHGGMGEVYLGLDEKLDRKVALKVLRPDMHTDPEAKNRFLREARILSQLAHPNICQIHDFLEGEVEEVIVLEFIEGRNLGRAIKEGLDLRRKLHIARQIATALAAAHEKSIVHRDLKPDNVMVMPGDQVKVLDFGLSLLLEDELATQALPRIHAIPAPPPEDPERTVASRPVRGGHESRASHETRSVAASSSRLTTLGTVMGTLRYMSPEQARGEEPTPATDLYALGLLFQELFTGSPAYEKGLDSALLLQKVQAGETRPVEGLDPDLAALISRLKALAPAARPSAIDTLERLTWIGEKPARKRLRILRAAAVTTLALFSAGAVFQAARISREKARADQESESARKAVDFLTTMFGEVDPDRSRGTSIPAREILDHAREKLEKEPAPGLLQADIGRTLGDLYGKLGLFEPASRLLENALKIMERDLKPDHLATARCRRSLAAIYSYLGRLQDAEALDRKALAVLEKSLGPQDLEVAAGLYDLGRLRYLQSQYPDAEALLKRALAIQEKALGQEAAETARSLCTLGLMVQQQGRFEEGMALLRRGLAIQEKRLGPEARQVAETLNNMALTCYQNGRAQEGLPLAERSLAIDEKVLGPEHPIVATNLTCLGNLQMALGRTDAAEASYRRALPLRIKALGPDHPDVALCTLSLAAIADAKGRDQESGILFLQAVDGLVRALGPDHAYLGQAQWLAGNHFVKTGDYARARPMLEKALAINEKVYGPSNDNVMGNLQSLTVLEASRGDKAATLAWFGRAVRQGLKDPSFWNPKPLARLQGNLDFEALAATVRGRAQAK